MVLFITCLITCLLKSPSPLHSNCLILKFLLFLFLTTTGAVPHATADVEDDKDYGEAGESDVQS